MKKTDKINILELESSLGFGGQEHRTQRVINGLNKDKFKVFYALNPGSKSFEKPIDCEFVKFNLSNDNLLFSQLRWHGQRPEALVLINRAGRHVTNSPQ